MICMYFNENIDSVWIITVVSVDDLNWVIISFLIVIKFTAVVLISGVSIFVVTNLQLFSPISWYVNAHNFVWNIELLFQGKGEIVSI